MLSSHVGAAIALLYFSNTFRPWFTYLPTTQYTYYSFNYDGIGKIFAIIFDVYLQLLVSVLLGIKMLRNFAN